MTDSTTEKKTGDGALDFGPSVDELFGDLEEESLGAEPVGQTITTEPEPEEEDIEDATASDVFEQLQSETEQETVDFLEDETPEDIIASADVDEPDDPYVDDDLLVDEDALDALLLTGRRKEDEFLWVEDDSSSASSRSGASSRSSITNSSSNSSSTKNSSRTSKTNTGSVSKSNSSSNSSTSKRKRKNSRQNSSTGKNSTVKLDDTEEIESTLELTRRYREQADAESADDSPEPDSTTRLADAGPEERTGGLRVVRNDEDEESDSSADATQTSTSSREPVADRAPKTNPNDDIITDSHANDARSIMGTTERGDSKTDADANANANAEAKTDDADDETTKAPSGFFGRIRSILTVFF